MEVVYVNDMQVVMRSFRELLAAKAVDVETKIEGENLSTYYTYTAEEYITLQELETYTRIMFPVTDKLQFQFLKELLMDVIEESGLMTLAFDEYHCPPLNEIELHPAFIPMAKYCIAVFTCQRKRSISIDGVEKLINEEVVQFTDLREGLENPKLKRETAEEIYGCINRYFV